MRIRFGAMSPKLHEQLIGDDWFCLDCDFDTLIPIEKQVANSQQN